MRPLPQQRLWRARRRHHHIDAALSEHAGAWTLTFHYDDARMLTWTFPTREAAAEEAERRLQGLLRAGWNAHW